MDDEMLIKCITFDQDCFRDVRMIAADQRQLQWTSEYLPELSKESQIEYLYIRDKLTRCHYKDAIFEISDSDNEVLTRIWIQNIVLLGSTQDGLYLEKEKGFLVYDSDKTGMKETDVDILFEYGGIEIVQIEQSADCKHSLYLCLEKTNNPGYFKLRICSRSLDKNKHDYFTPNKLKHKLFLNLDSTHFYVSYNSPGIVTNTPAIGGSFEDELGIYETDYVPALTMKQWPSVAESFISRTKPSGWPSPALIMAATAEGCGFVAKGYCDSVDTDIQWRISFAASEKILTRSLTSSQIRAHLFFKSIFKVHLQSDNDELSSYMMKNILFWTLETIEQASWSDDNVLYCVEALVDMLCECLDNCLIVSFFLPRLNLIGHLDRHTVNEIAIKAHRIQDDVMSAIIKCTESPEFEGMCDISLTSMKYNMMEDSDEASSILSMVYFTLYLYLRLQVVRYQLKLGLTTLKESYVKECNSMRCAIAPRAVWYLLESIRVQPDSSLFGLDIHGKDNFILDVNGMRAKVVEFFRCPTYSGLFKEVLNDQERVINKTFTQIPEFSKFLEWVDLTCMWNGGPALNKDNLVFPIVMD